MRHLTKSKRVVTLRLLWRVLSQELSRLVDAPFWQGKCILMMRLHITVVCAIIFSDCRMDSVGVSSSQNSCHLEYLECTGLYWIRTASQAKPFLSLADMYLTRPVTDHWDCCVFEPLCQLSMADLPFRVRYLPSNWIYPTDLWSSSVQSSTMAGNQRCHSRRLLLVRRTWNPGRILWWDPFWLVPSSSLLSHRSNSLSSLSGLHSYRAFSRHLISIPTSLLFIRISLLFQMV
jgi:hypothetical protein